MARNKNKSTGFDRGILKMTPEHLAARQERARSNAAGTMQDPRNARNRTRAAQKRNAMRDYA